MYRKFALLPFALLLAACGKEEPSGVLECANPAVLQDIRGSIQETLKQEARSFARDDVRQFVDADKIIAAAYDLAFSLEHASETREGSRTFCIADLNITVPSETLADAKANSPLLYGETALSDIVQQKTGGNVEFKDGVLTAAVRFLPAKDAQTAFVDNTVGMAAQTLSAALLPYGVKSIVMIDGKAVKKEDAVRILSGKAHEAPSKPTPEDILEHNAAGGDADVPQAGEDAPEPEILHPDDSERANTVTVSRGEVEEARVQNQRAESEITKLWGGLDTDVQKELVGEQRKWAQEKISNCRQAAAQADRQEYAEYLKLQCETRMTRERIQYLRGYAID